MVNMKNQQSFDPKRGYANSPCRADWAIEHIYGKWVVTYRHDRNRRLEFPSSEEAVTWVDAWVEVWRARLGKV